MKRIFSVDGLFGDGDFYYEDGQFVGYSVDITISGEDFYGPAGTVLFGSVFLILMVFLMPERSGVFFAPFWVN